MKSPTKICSICQRELNISPKLWKDTPKEADIFCSPRCIVFAIQANSGLHKDITEREKTKKPVVSEFLSDYSVLLNRSFRSKFEVVVAEYFTQHNMKYLYEEVTIELFGGTKHWTPDLYFPEYRTFVEIKGVWAFGGKRKYIEAAATIDEPIILIPYWMKGLFKAI